MKNKNEWFTLVELTISIFIISVVIIWISLSLTQISKNFFDSEIKTNIFSQVKDFNYDTYFFKYNSWIILTWWILLYDDKKWFLIWSFVDENGGYDYKLKYDNNLYNEYYFWFFLLNDKTLSWILNNPLSIYDFKFNDWKIYNKLIIKDLNINKYNSINLYEINLNIFKNFKKDYSSKTKEEFFIQKDDYLKINFNF